VRVRATPLVLLIGVLWVIITIFGLVGWWFPALLLSVVLMAAHLVLGAAHDGRIRLDLLFHPILTWAALWLASFWLAEVFARADAGSAPPFTLLGLSPSFACIVLGYWVGGVVTLTLGFFARRRLWMTDEQWVEFSREVARLNESSGAG